VVINVERQEKRYRAEVWFSNGKIWWFVPNSELNIYLDSPSPLDPFLKKFESGIKQFLEGYKLLRVSLSYLNLVGW